jgi:hypothetical protein
MGGTRRLGQSPRGMWAKQGPTLLDDRRRSRASTPGLRFDVVVISLKNAGGFNIRGLPIHVILGRPAFVIFDTVGSVEAIAQAHALMKAWGLRKLEVSLLLFRKRNIRNANFGKRPSTICPPLQTELLRIRTTLGRCFRRGFLAV